nr:unnamed protein product [Callosobruchus analis]
MYANDTTLLITSSSISDLASNASEELKLVHSWFLNNELVSNGQKSQFVHFTLSQLNHDSNLLVRSLHGSIKQEEMVKFLGIYLSENCKWEDHIDRICKKLRPVTYCINQLRNVANQLVVITYYYACFHFTMSYCILVWGVHYTRNGYLLCRREY